MATTPVSGSTNGNSFVLALGTGSGVDIKTLAENLVNAEKQPKAELIQKGIDKNKARIAGYEVVGRAVAQIREALDALSNPAAFATFTSSSSQPSAVSITGSASASSGQHEVQVQQLARAQRSIGTGATSAWVMGTEAGTGAATVNILVGAPPAQAGDPDTRTALTVSAADSKPESIVKAINDQGWSVKASLVQMTGASGGEVRIVLTGQTGEANQFSASIQDAGANSLASFSTSQSALDARLTVDGVANIVRSSNTIEGAIPGATLTLKGLTVGDPAKLDLVRDASPAKEKIKQLVASYNDLQAIIGAAQDPNSSVETLGGSLVGDTTIRGIRDRIRNILMPPSGSSVGTITSGGVTTSYQASGSSTLSGLRDLGVMIDTDGTMKFSSVKAYDPLSPQAALLKIGDESTLDEKLAKNFDDVAAMFQGSGGIPGIASDMSDLVSGNGRYMDTSFTPSSPAKLVTATQRNANSYVQADTERLSRLEERMKVLLERYMKQFAIMDSLVGQSKSMQSGVESSFKAMSGQRG